MGVGGALCEVMLALRFAKTGVGALAAVEFLINFVLHVFLVQRDCVCEERATGGTDNVLPRACPHPAHQAHHTSDAITERYKKD